MELSLNLFSCSFISNWGTDDAEPAQMHIKIIPTSPRLMGNFDIFICSSWIKELGILHLIGTDLDVVLGCGKAEGQGISVADLDLIHIHLDAAVCAIRSLQRNRSRLSWLI